MISKRYLKSLIVDEKFSVVTVPATKVVRVTLKLGCSNHYPQNNEYYKVLKL